MTDAHGERDVLLIGTITVGRDPSCEVSIADPSMSRHHAEFVDAGSGVLVRDLHSQNGITVNNVIVKEALLQPGDVVQISSVVLRYVEEAAPAAPHVDAGGGGPKTDDRTVVMASPPTFSRPLGGAAAPPPAAGEPVDDDRTRAMPPPVMSRVPMPPPGAAPSAPPAATTEGATQAMRQPGGAAVPGHTVPASGGPAGGGASAGGAGGAAPVHAAPSAAPGAAAAAGALARGAAAKPARAQSAAPADAGRAAAEPAPRAARAARSSWGARVLWRVLALALIVSLGSAVPLMWWHNEQMNAVGVSRATAIVNWLAADAATALAGGQDVSAATAAVSSEPGVVAARIMMPDGRVIAPATRSAERVEYIPGIGASPNDVLRLRWGWNGDQLEVVRPVAVKTSPRAALAWVTLTPTSEFGGSSAVVTAPIVLLSVILGWIVAILITRSTLKPLSQVNEDIELALSGRIDAVNDPLGARPVKDLTDTINYLVARLRGTGIDPVGDRAAAAVAAAGAASSAPVPAGAAATAPGGRAASPPPAAQAGSGRRDVASSSPAPRVNAAPAVPPATEARLTVNPAFQVTEAAPGCADVLGVRPDALIGRHLLDAIQDRAIADAVLGCLSGLSAQGEREAPAVDALGRRLLVKVSRAGKDQPIAIVLRTTTASGSPTASTEGSPSGQEPRPS